MDINYGLSMEQKQLLSQSQIQSLELLSMCNTELNGFLENEYLENPLLEQNSTISQPSSVGTVSKEERQPLYEKKVEEKNGIADYLKEQLYRGAYSEAEWNVIEHLIGCLDDNGFFTVPIKEIAKLTNAEEKTVEDCLEDLRQLEPYGVFAQDLSHSLLRQLNVMGIKDENLEAIICNHLEAVSNGKISVITRALKISSLQVRKYIAFIATLNPRPLQGFQTGENTYIVPDIIIHKEGNNWEVTLNDSWIGNYELNDYYMKMMTEADDPELNEYFKNKLERARFILTSIEQRRKTILAIANEVLVWQMDYFEERGDCKPMTMKDVAEKIGIHASTVSRAVKDKYIQYPGGSILMKTLFSSAVSSHQDCETMTAVQIKKVIRCLVESENKKKPYSDLALAEELKKKSISLSRRGVAKYREEMGIRGSYERKDVTAAEK